MTIGVFMTTKEGVHDDNWGVQQDNWDYSERQLGGGRIDGQKQSQTPSILDMAEIPY